MDYHSTTRIPVDDEYAALLGKAVYVFAYYEWSIIYIIEHLKPGFVSEYSRGKSKTSGVVNGRLKQMIEETLSLPTQIKDELKDCTKTFKDLIESRNALIHAHPITYLGDQILGYQGEVSKPIADKIWIIDKLKILIKEIDDSSIKAAEILEKLQKKKY